MALAKSKSRQVPLGPVDETQLSEEVRQLRAWAAAPYSLATLGPARAACLTWLKSEYLK
jgi:iron(III) transport system substrate-binding protein